MDDDEIWDEHQWEDFLREADRRADLLVRLREEYVRDHPPPHEDAPEAEHEAWQRGLHDWLTAQLGGLPPGWAADAEEPGPEEGEGWKAGFVEAYPEAQGLHDLPAYRAAHAFATAVLDWAYTVPHQAKDVVFVDFCSHALQVAAGVAAGHELGYEAETLGGNIAVTKRGLRAANRALAALQQLRDAAYLTRADYLRLYEQAYEVRNAVGLHVQHLRERFERGVG